MAKATWRVLAFGALLGAAAPVALIPAASAQVIIGGAGESDVVVNWSVLDELGQQPSLADMIKGELPGRKPQAAAPRAARQAGPPQGAVYKPFKPNAATPTRAVDTAKPVLKPVQAAAAPAAPVPAPVVAADGERRSVPIVEASKPAAKPPAATGKPAVPAKPQIADVAPAPVALAPVAPAKVPPVSPPEVKAEPPKPVEIAKPVEVPKPLEQPKPVEIVKPVELPKPAPVVAAAPQPLLSPVPPAVSMPPQPVVPPQVAALPSSEPPAMSGGSDTISLAFDAEDAKVSDRARNDLVTLVKRMQKDEDLNLQLLAYASGDEASASKARRLSLSRALEVRKYLMDKGIRSTRIEVRALGNKLDGRGSPDRVDAVLVGR
ncbi:OmpA family protein [Magnetospirillum gryphiswaldense]|uniref:OmpA family protein n=1 Tax=Magnetospirillum gryphiswaldense TaxID=55518 RepID=UPI000D02DE47|nr:OmpA family protein [Magnetospirillum gryphiswaldense]AVM74448.1 OmpA family protein [Magnetospirillum gryphiswaldense MSR-1]AVM78351.1 OmpA family protein [Magnetospirillum gryphiswaldense]